MSKVPQMFSMLLADYGADVTTEDGRRDYAKACRPARARDITSSARYVAICRALGLEGDWRLIAVGWNHVPPREWVAEGFAKFYAYWSRVAKRPDIVGSSYNPDHVEAGAAYFAGIPAGIVGRAPLRDREGRIRRMGRERRVRLLSAARAAARTSIGYRHVATKTLARLGQLCPELQRAALASLPNYWTQNPLRVRDLDWPAVAKLQAALAVDYSGRVRAASAEGKRQRDLMWGKDAAWMCPSYPDVPMSIATRIARGEKPAALSAEVDSEARLTRAEAHAWCLGGARENVLAWWCERYLPEGTPAVRSWAVARWLRAVHERGDWAALLRERTIRGPAGAEAVVRYLDRVDEIQDCDLVRGPRTGVEPAFTHAAERVGEAWLEKARRDHRVLAGLPSGWRLYPKCMRPLVTPAQLAREGDEMGHCVGGYAPAVANGNSVILALDVRGQRSTVELDRRGRVLQHRGPKNEEPHRLCAAVLERAARRNGWEV